MIWYMNRRSVLIGLVGGIAVTALVLLVLPEPTRFTDMRLLSSSFGERRMAFLWLALLGVAVGAAIIISKRYPLIVAVPAVLLGYGYYVISPTGQVVLLDPLIPGSVVVRLLYSFGPAALMHVGVLAAVAVWRIVLSKRQKPSNSSDVVERRDTIVGVLAGIGTAIAFLAVLGRVELALTNNGRAMDLPGMRMMMLVLFVIGAAVGVLIILNDRLPLLAASAAASLIVFVVLHPMFGIFPTEGAWVFLFRNRLLVSAGVVHITGILLAVGAWRLLSMRRSDTPIEEPE